jgi:putative tricarboxylic transport membrane protein
MMLSDKVTGGFLVALGGLAAWGGSRLPAVPGQDVGPAAFPMIIGIGLALCGGLIAVGVGRSFEVDDEPAAGPGPWRLGALRALVPCALLLGYMLLVDRLGFLLTGFAVVGLASIALGARLRLAAPVAVAATLFIHAVFSKLLRVPLPDGLLAAPW